MADLGPVQLLVDGQREHPEPEGDGLEAEVDEAATEDFPHGLADHWLEPIRRLARAYAVDLAQAPDLEIRRDRLAELNVIEGVRRVAETPILQRAWTRHVSVRVHGLIYGLKDGRLRNLDCTIGPGHFLQETSA